MLLFALQDVDRPTSNPLPPQSEAFTEYQNASVVSAQQMLENVAQQVPNFGTELVCLDVDWFIVLSLIDSGSSCTLYL